MKTGEVFRIALSEGIQDKWLLDKYWGLELYLAGFTSEGYSRLEDYGDPSARTCVMCGHVCDTDEAGGLPRMCPNKRCEQVRTFFGIKNYPRLLLTTKKECSSRVNWLRTKGVRFFGGRGVYDAPKELLFDFLILSMVERIGHESNNGRVENVPV